MDFIVEHSVFNYIDPPPERLPAMEQAVPARFNIPQLDSLVKELRLLANDQGRVGARAAVNLLRRRTNHSKSLADQGGLPEAWSSLCQMSYERMVRNLDSTNSGSVDHKLLGLCCILLLSPLPTKDQLRDLAQKQLGNQT